ncbi:Putative uncharacterized protein [Taphrina deformans PYCC 5710]|uniref:CID domain-containing protein n=1 Tax=Taphrina deformans (strain PYCC 5710 / ATCC 11124 / CBS 356.35 / IMI 108563 / JCM 9778 / NBRC 8474) TaxID=1097556 RepID=R4X7H9_TAPDE|nr:Putative uncharacterized protein [Taphrina deformans PYCC 5710]|eukprot:CCG81366.1 Putative uncharacterized protein [Taphrina deformans PYCC 5710]
MDPFEGRLQFLDLLRRLQASQSSQLKTAQFAIRYRDLDEDLFSCILEELSTTSFNAKVNILYFLETLCDTARRSKCTTYVTMVQRDLREIIDHVAPPGVQGTANVAQTRLFLKKMVEKGYLSAQEHEAFDSNLSAREPEPTTSDAKVNTSHAIGKEDILRRIEEDRERHKRLRESLWVVPPGDEDYEFNQAWEETSALCDDDFEVIREELALYKQSLTV